MARVNTPIPGVGPSGSVVRGAKNIIITDGIRPNRGQMKSVEGCHIVTYPGIPTSRVIPSFSILSIRGQNEHEPIYKLNQRGGSSTRSD